MHTQTHKTLNFRLLFISSAFLLCFLFSTEIFGTNKNPVADFDGDGKTDISVFRPSDRYWYISKSSGGFLFIPWGLSGDRLMPGDYDGDGKTDLAVFRRGETDRSGINHWYILRSSDFTFRAVAHGLIEGNNVSRPAPPADYDGDGKTDVATFTQPYTFDSGGPVAIANYFDVLQSSTNSIMRRTLPLTFSGAVVSADYDGDGKADFASYDNYNNGLWRIEQSSNGSVRFVSFGLERDISVPADYDGDGKVDIAVWRPSNGYWYWLSSRNGSFNSYQFGQSGDTAVPGDYDGDGRSDLAIFRGSTGVWYIQQSRDGFRAVQFGMSGDIPIPR